MIGEGVELQGAGNILETSTGNAGIFYSSELVNDSEGISAVVSYSSRVTAYLPQ